MNDVSASQAFAALGNQHRVALLRLLVRAGGEGMNVTALREQLGLPASTLAHHLRTLVDAELVRQRRDGRELVSTAYYPRIRELATFLMKDCCKGVFKAGQAA